MLSVLRLNDYFSQAHIVCIILLITVAVGCQRSGKDVQNLSRVDDVMSNGAAAAHEFLAASVIVNYDLDGNIWLTGRSVKKTEVLTTIEGLSVALSEIEEKGTAAIVQVCDIQQASLLGPAPQPDKSLEASIRSQLIQAGFECR